MSALDGTVCPKVLVTGLKPNYRKELSLAFGDYVEVHMGTDNTSRERSVTCIALYPVGNATGMWQFWNIINGIAEDEHGTEGVTDNLPETPDPDEEKSKEGDAEENQDEEAEKEKAQSNKGETTTVPDTGGQTLGQTSRRNARIAAGVKPSEWFVHASFVERKRWQEEAAKEAIKAEIRQLEPIKAETILAGVFVLTCHMFLVEKFLATPHYTLATTANSTIHRETSNNTTKHSLTPTRPQTRETLSTILLEIPTTKNKKHKHNTEDVMTYIPKTNKLSTKTITKTIKNSN
jgi:hypothetical protein